jgi:cytochrome c
MKAFMQALILVSFVLGVSISAYAGDRGTKDDAQALVKKIISFHKANGKEKAISEGNNPSGAFQDRDLRIVAYASNGIVIIHGNPKLVGKNLSDFRGPDGTWVVKEIISIGMKKGSGSGEFKALNTTTKAVVDKGYYVEKYEEFIYACEYFK